MGGAASGTTGSSRAGAVFFGGVTGAAAALLAALRALRALAAALVFVFRFLAFFAGAAVLSTPPSDDLTASPTDWAMAATAPPALSTNPFIVDWTPSTTSSGGPSSSFIIAAIKPTVTRPPPRASAALRDFLLLPDIVVSLVSICAGAARSFLEQ